MMDSTIVLDESSAELQIVLDSATVSTNASIEVKIIKYLNFTLCQRSIQKKKISA